MADNARQDPRRLFVLLDLYTLVCIFHAPEKSPKGFERIKLLKTEIVVKMKLPTPPSLMIGFRVSL